MSFKNALKNLVAHFGTVWSLLLYFVIFAAVITGLSLPFILPIARAFEEAGVFENFIGAFKDLFADGGWNGMMDKLYAAYNSVKYVFENNSRVASLVTIFLIFVVVVLFRFFLGLYEIPLATVLDGQLSCNARYGFGGKFFSTLWLSVRFSFMKMLYTVLFDVITSFAVYGIGKGMGMNAALPFVEALAVIVIVAFRFSIASCWSPCVASGEYGIFGGFAHSAAICFKRFGTVYSTYLVSLMLLVAVSVLFTLFTLGVGLIIALPFSAAYIGYINATVYYNKSGKRYYIDGMVFTTPTENVL